MTFQTATDRVFINLLRIKDQKMKVQEILLVNTGKYKVLYIVE